MTLQNFIEEAKRLSLPEQIELWAALGDMIGPPPEVPMTSAQRADLEKRIAEHRAGKAQMIPGPEAFAQLRERR